MGDGRWERIRSGMFKTAFVTLASVNFDRVVEFYRQFLGATPEVYIPAVYAEFSVAGLRLGIFRPNASHQAEFGRSSSEWDEFMFGSG